MSLPTGTVTFLFTDIEGSTVLLQRLGSTYQRVLEDHRRMLRTAFQASGGREVDTQGDAFFVAFLRAADAIAASVTMQKTVLEYAWPGGEQVRVRMGVHTGEPALSDEGYVGLDVHRAARICSAGHGGQILLSKTTRDLIEHDLPEEVVLRDLGRHRLKDLAHSEHLYQVMHPGLPSDFPPIRSVATRSIGLPRRLTSFIGRETEIEEVKRLLATTRLLTVVGIGGAGKTRLALQVADRVVEEYSHGVYLVELAQVADPGLVAQAIAASLGVREDPGRPLIESLKGHLQTRQMLLVLDNCEQVVDAVAGLATELLGVAPGLRLLCTSREALAIAGEAAWRIPSLSVPDPRRPADRNALESFESVRLFVERAGDVVPGFVLTDQNAPAIIQICRRLDGIPLAIELAASRVRVLTPDQIAARLDDRFRLLAGGSRSAMPRQQTLKAAMDWSYDLLTSQEAAVLRRLSVFSRGCTLDAAEAVCAADDVASHEVLDLLTRLVDKSLVVVEEEDRENRYRLLETVKQYSRDKLVEAGEAPAVRHRHLAWFLALAETAGPKLQTAEQLVWLSQLDAEHDNIRGALEWALESAHEEIPCRMTEALWWFWTLRGHTSEGREWLNKAIARATQPSSIRAQTVASAGMLAFFAADFAAATALGEEALGIGRDLGDGDTTGYALVLLAMVDGARGNYERAMSLAEESLALTDVGGHPWEKGAVLSVMGSFAYQAGDFVRAEQLLQEGLTVFKDLGDRWGLAFALQWLGLLARSRGDYTRASAMLEESLALSRQLGHNWGIASTLLTMALTPIRQGDYPRATAYLKESLALFEELAEPASQSRARHYLGLIAYYQSDYHRAQMLLEGSLAFARQTGMKDAVSQILAVLGRLALQQGDGAKAMQMGREALTISQETGAQWPRAYALRLLAATTLHQRDFDSAASLAAESFEIFRAVGDMWAVAWALQLLGEIALARGDNDGARARFAEALEIRSRQGERLGIAESIEGIAASAAGDGPPEQVARLLGAASALRESLKTPPASTDAGWYTAALAAVRERLSPDSFQAAWARGRAMPTDEAAAHALELSHPVGRAPSGR
ncbi:MAG TPA: tetratricopeptide repeat protein [bacterium]|nr:tetratricopeptide repeat protein [bacterium]